MSINQSRRPGLLFHRLDIRRMPGISDGFSIDDRSLCHGVNIILGPNGSGKSTTAMALHALLWPALAPPLASVAGAFTVDGVEWQIVTDAGIVVRQRDGSDADAPDIAPAESRDRYLLCLRDLLAAEETNASFARAIFHESQGGFDLDTALRQLGYAPPSLRRGQRQHDLDVARDRVRKLEQVERELAAQENGLADLRERKLRALAAVKRAAQLELALELDDKRLAYDEHRRHVDSFPSGIDRLAGDEVQVLYDLDQHLERLRERERNELLSKSRAEGDRAATGLEGATIPDGLIRTLRARCQELLALAGDKAALERDVAQARAERDSAREMIGAGLDEERLASLDVAGVRELAKLTAEEATLRGEQEAAESLGHWIGQVVLPANLDQMRQGLVLLNRRLQLFVTDDAVRGDVRARRAALSAAVLFVATAVALAIVVHWTLIALAALGLALLFVVRKPPTLTTAVEASLLERQYTDLGLERPESWTADNLRKVADRLSQQIREGEVEREKAARWDDLQAKRDRLREACQRVATKRAALIERFGVAPDGDQMSLTLIAENLSRWQAATSRLNATQAKRDQAATQHQTLLDTLNRDLMTFGYTAAAHHADVESATTALEERWRQHNDADRAIATACAILDETIRPEIERVEQQRRAVYERLGITFNDNVALQERLNRLDAYRDARLALARAEIVLVEFEDKLADSPELRGADRGQLEADLREAELLIAEKEQLTEQIHQIETRIADAKSKRDLEAALVARQACIDALVDAREDDYRATAGSVLGDFVRTQTRDRTRPPVFHYARDLFAQITMGRYRLEFVDGAIGADPRFRAIDTDTSLGHALDELSSGTRVQLLLAVRLAFLETHEYGPKLPLLLDETLGNSDEQRAAAIIEATIEIARTGRQVFYFTAQPDEVGKWAGILKDRPDQVPFSILDLAEVRYLAAFERAPLKIIAPDQTTIPTPDGHSHEEYGLVLQVPALDPWAADITEVHLWYVINEPNEIHRLLTIGIRTWGQLRTLLDHGGETLLASKSGTTAVFDRVEARARLCRDIIQQWRIGRGRPLDRVAIQNSGIVTETFVDAVCQLLAEVDGDAQRLLDALDAGRISRFRQKAIDDLRQHFIEHEFLPLTDPLPYDDLKLRVLAAAAADIQAGHLSHHDIDTLVAVICGPAR